MILGGHFDVDAKDKRIKELEDILNQPNIWNDNVYASKVNSELINLKKELSDLKKARDRKSTRLNSSHSGQSRMPSSA